MPSQNDDLAQNRLTMLVYDLGARTDLPDSTNRIIDLLADVRSGRCL